MVVLFAGFVFVGGTLRLVFPFLATNQKADADTLIVEGWISFSAMRDAVAEICSNSYTHVFTTGGPLAGTGPYSNDQNTYARLGRDRLLRAGLTNLAPISVPCRVRDRDRTYSSALALKQWFIANDFHPASINIFSDSVHARRSRLLFQKVFGSDLKIGVIAAPPADYPPQRWWRYSEGVKDVISEGAAYLYVRVFFWP
jgi:uncharacterized SAM-binding protein YcdF (DUF218 family)